MEAETKVLIALRLRRLQFILALPSLIHKLLLGGARTEHAALVALSLRVPGFAPRMQQKGDGTA